MSGRSEFARPIALWLALAGVLASVAVVRGLFDPDYFWHLATGRLILDTGQVPTTDPFSFTWFGQPWIPDQWLAQVAIAAGDSLLGAGVMLAVFGGIAAIGPAAVAAAAMRSGGRAWLAVLTATAVTAAMLWQVTIRPQVVSFALMGILLALLIRARPENRNRLWLLPPLFLLWANTHGFFITGLGVGFVYMAATMAGRTPLRQHWRLVALIGLVSLAATMVTPSGPGGLLYALSFGDPTDLGARQISEWQSPNFHSLQFVPFLGVLALLFLADIRRAPGWMTLVAIVGALLGLYAVRAIGIGALMIMPAVLVREPADASQLKDGERGRRMLELGASALVAVALIASAFASGPVTVDPRRVPVPATQYLRDNWPDARVLAAYEWGGYVINELHDLGGTVFVDGRMHKYAPQVMADYVAIVDAEPGWERLVDDYGVDAILLQPHTALVRGAAQDAGWCEAFRDDIQVLLFRCDDHRAEGTDGLARAGW